MRLRQRPRKGARRLSGYRPTAYSVQRRPVESNAVFDRHAPHRASCRPTPGGYPHAGVRLLPFPSFSRRLWCSMITCLIAAPALRRAAVPSWPLIAQIKKQPALYSQTRPGLRGSCSGSRATLCSVFLVGGFSQGKCRCSCMRMIKRRRGSTRRYLRGN